MTVRKKNSKKKERLRTKARNKYDWGKNAREKRKKDRYVRKTGWGMKTKITERRERMT